MAKKKKNRNQEEIKEYNVTTEDNVNITDETTVKEEQQNDISIKQVNREEMNEIIQLSEVIKNSTAVQLINKQTLALYELNKEDIKDRITLRNDQCISVIIDTKQSNIIKGDTKILGSTNIIFNAVLDIKLVKINDDKVQLVIKSDSPYINIPLNLELIVR